MIPATRFLWGSADIITLAGAQATDLPAKAQPVEYM
jgi:hypothetical protein